MYSFRVDALDAAQAALAAVRAVVIWARHHLFTVTTLATSRNKPPPSTQTSRVSLRDQHLPRWWWRRCGPAVARTPPMRAVAPDFDLRRRQRGVFDAVCRNSKPSPVLRPACWCPEVDGWPARGACRGLASPSWLNQHWNGLINHRAAMVNALANASPKRQTHHRLKPLPDEESQRPVVGRLHGWKKVRALVGCRAG
jgi:hypothetical protein